MIELIRRAPKLEQFHNQFDTEQACIRHLFQTKWPGGFVCPRCTHPEACTIATRRMPLYQCRRCRHQTSLLAGTIMEGSRTPLLKWYTAMFLLARTGVGITAVQLRKIIGVTYKTSWLMLNKIRQAISEADAAVRLSGSVRVNRNIFGRPSHYRTNHRHANELHLFTGGTVDEEDAVTYVKIKLVPRDQLQSIYKPSKADGEFTSSHVDEGELDTLFFPRPLKSRLHASLAHCYRMAQSWIRHTFKGIGKKYVQNYLDEFCFCFNQEQSGSAPFQNLVLVCSASGKGTRTVLRARSIA